MFGSEDTDLLCPPTEVELLMNVVEMVTFYRTSAPSGYGLSAICTRTQPCDQNRGGFGFSEILCFVGLSGKTCGSETKFFRPALVFLLLDTEDGLSLTRLHIF